MTEKEKVQITVLTTPSQEHASTCSLVLAAVNIPHSVDFDNTNYLINVPTENAALAIYHLRAYKQENKNWPPPQESTDSSTSTMQPPTLLVIAGLILFYYITGPWSSQSDWFIFGAGDSTAILTKGEYYRLITPLTLHADIIHLLGNCLMGGFLLHFFCRSTGPGIGLFATLVAAVLGNYVNVLIRGDGHIFVGFSTAVFAIIGMLAMISFHSKRKLTKLQVVLPLMAGVGLLAMTGSSGERTDLGAHLFGLLSGFAIGRLLITDFLTRLRTSPTLQTVLFLLTAIIVYMSWDIAMVIVH